MQPRLRQKGRSDAPNTQGDLMSDLIPKPRKSGTPFPRYLIRADARVVLDEIKSAGFQVELTVPGPGSVQVSITGPDGQERSEIGRPDDLEAALRQLAERCGLPLKEF